MWSNAEIVVWKFLAITSFGTCASQSVSCVMVNFQTIVLKIALFTKNVESSLKSPSSKTCNIVSMTSDFNRKHEPYQEKFGTFRQVGGCL